MVDVSWGAVAADFVLGLALGGVGGVFGIGGGLMAIPILVWFFGLDQTLAQGTALVMVVPNVALGFWRYKQRNPIQWRPVLWLGAASALSASITAWWATRMSATHLQHGFALFLLAIAGLMARAAWKTHRAAGPRVDEAGERAPALPSPGMVALGLFSGLASGLFTVGGGLVVAPALTAWFGVRRQTLAQGLGLAAVTPGSVAALLAYGQAGQVDWALGLPLAAGGLMGVSWGVAWAHRLPEAALRGAFSAFLVLVAGALI